MATRRSYEEVADLLWRSPSGSWVPATSGPPPPGLAVRDLLRWSVVMTGAADPIRHDLRPEAIVASARRVIATMIQTIPGTLPITSAGGAESGPIAERVALRLCTSEPGPATVKAVNAAMVLLADHELATSTLAARLAASTRADLYDVILAALGTLAGPLHGGASTLVRTLLADADQHGLEWAVSESLRWRSGLPGFGHTVYASRDPRADVLLELFGQLADRRQRQTVDSLLEIARTRALPAPNVDLALAAIGYATGMPPDAGETIFTIARTAGWTAHAMEELEERPLRFRARAVYLTAGH
jgi:citrate synthase